MRIGFVGAGAAASALAGAFAGAGLLVVAVASRRPEQAAALAARLPGTIAIETAQEVVDRADLVFLAVPDDAIQAVCDGLRWRSGAQAVHCSGAQSIDVLASARTMGAGTGSCHPLQTLAGTDDDAGRLAGCLFGIEAGEPLRSMLQDLVRRIGGQPLLLEAGSKPLYHAAAVLVSNYVVTLAALATDLWSALGVERSDALRALAPLLRGTVDNLEQQGLPEALTGPIARGDVVTVRRHLEALATQAPESLTLYRELGRMTITVARERGLPDPAALALLETLRPVELPERDELRQEKGTRRCA